MKDKPRSLFSREALRKLRKDGFTGKLFVEWDNGVINDMELKTNIAFRKHEIEGFC